MAKTALPTSIRLDPDLKAALTAAAEDDGRSVSAMTDRILRAWLIERGFLPKPETARSKPTAKPKKAAASGR